jgi:hypothetical protein
MNENDPKIPVPPDLPGEAAAGAYGIRTGGGIEADPSLGIFPIVRYDAQNRTHLVGTGFFITTSGLFVTARHVLMDVFDKRGHQVCPIGIFQFLPGNIFIPRPILRFVAHSVADVAVGVAAPMNRNRDASPLTNPVLTLTTVPPALKTRVVTYAYPKHINLINPGEQVFHVSPTFYDGYIQESLPNGRDRVSLPGPCYRTDIIIHSGASGGPVFCPSGRVFGVNSTGWDGSDTSYISRIDEIFQLVIDGIAIGTSPARSVSGFDIARAGGIVVVPPIVFGPA